MADSKYIDLADGLTRLRGNKKLYARMLGMFEAGPEFQQLEDALAAGDNAAAGDAAHAIKGISGNLSLPALFALSTDLMNQLRQGDADPQTLADYRQALAATLEQVEAVKQELAE